MDGPPLGECCPPPNLEYGEEYSDKRPTIMDVGGHVQMLGDGREVRGYAYSGFFPMYAVYLYLFIERCGLCVSLG